VPSRRPVPLPARSPRGRPEGRHHPSALCLTAVRQPGVAAGVCGQVGSGIPAEDFCDQKEGISLAERFCLSELWMPCLWVARGAQAPPPVDLPLGLRGGRCSHGGRGQVRAGSSGRRGCLRSPGLTSPCSGRDRPAAFEPSQPSTPWPCSPAFGPLPSRTPRAVRRNGSGCFAYAAVAPSASALPGAARAAVARS